MAILKYNIVKLDVFLQQFCRQKQHPVIQLSHWAVQIILSGFRLVVTVVTYCRVCHADFSGCIWRILVRWTTKAICDTNILHDRNYIETFCYYFSGIYQLLF
jgi:hypothetical protein